MEFTDVWEVLTYSIFVAGAFVCCLNFYLSFLRYPLCRLRGQEYKWVSGVPVFGSLLLVIALAMVHDSPVFFWIGTSIALLDTGGLHWFAVAMLWMCLFRRERK